MSDTTLYFILGVSLTMNIMFINNKIKFTLKKWKGDINKKK